MMAARVLLALLAVSSVHAYAHAHDYNVFGTMEEAIAMAGRNLSECGDAYADSVCKRGMRSADDAAWLEQQILETDVSIAYEPGVLNPTSIGNIAYIGVHTRRAKVRAHAKRVLFHIRMFYYVKRYIASPAGEVVAAATLVVATAGVVSVFISACMAAARETARRWRAR